MFLPSCLCLLSVWLPPGSNFPEPARKMYACLLHALPRTGAYATFHSLRSTLLPCPCTIS